MNALNGGTSKNQENSGRKNISFDRVDLFSVPPADLLSAADPTARLRQNIAGVESGDAK